MNLDGNAASHRALCLFRQENPRWQSVVVRSRRYLNNIVEQDHRAIKRRCAPMLALKTFRTAVVTLAGDQAGVLCTVVSDGGGLYLLVTPKGGRCRRYAYRFAQKQ